MLNRVSTSVSKQLSHQTKCNLSTKLTYRPTPYASLQHHRHQQYQPSWASQQHGNKRFFATRQHQPCQQYSTANITTFNAMTMRQSAKVLIPKQQYSAPPRQTLAQLNTSFKTTTLLPALPLLAITPALTRDMDIEYYANEQHYKENIEYQETGDIVINIRQIQRIVMKDAFLCKKYMRYILETIEDAKEMLHMTQRRINMMIEATQHEPTIQIYRQYLLKIDEEIDALEGFMQLGLLTVMPVSNIHKHLFRQIDEANNEGGLDAEFNLARYQFDVVHEQLNQIAELSNKCDGLVDVVDNVIVELLGQMMRAVDGVEENKLPHDFEEFNGPGVGLQPGELGKDEPEAEMPDFLKAYYHTMGVDEQRKARDKAIRESRKAGLAPAQELLASDDYKRRGQHMPDFQGFNDDEDEFVDFVMHAAKEQGSFGGPSPSPSSTTTTTGSLERLHK